jgi:hypothetical protein
VLLGELTLKWLKAELHYRERVLVMIVGLGLLIFSVVLFREERDGPDIALTPNVEATVEAAVSATLVSQPTDTPTTTSMPPSVTPNVEAPVAAAVSATSGVQPNETLEPPIPSSTEIKPTKTGTSEYSGLEGVQGGDPAPPVTKIVESNGLKAELVRVFGIGKFVTVEVKITNLGNESKSFFEWGYARSHLLDDTTGEKYLEGDNFPLDGKHIPPETTVEAWVKFEISDDVQPENLSITLPQGLRFDNVPVEWEP